MFTFFQPQCQEAQRWYLVSSNLYFILILSTQDFVEILKLYDKNEDNTMLAHELFRLLTNLGEKLTKDEAKSLMKELCDPADDEGFMPFIRKLFNLLYY